MWWEKERAMGKGPGELEEGKRKKLVKTSTWQSTMSSFQVVFRCLPIYSHFFSEEKWLSTIFCNYNNVIHLESRTIDLWLILKDYRHVM